MDSLNPQRERRLNKLNFFAYFYNILHNNYQKLITNIRSKFKKKPADVFVNNPNLAGEEVNEILETKEIPHVRKKRQIIDAPYKENIYRDCNGEQIEIFE